MIIDGYFYDFNTDPHHVDVSKIESFEETNEPNVTSVQVGKLHFLVKMSVKAVERLITEQRETGD